MSTTTTLPPGAQAAAAWAAKWQEMQQQAHAATHPAHLSHHAPHRPVVHHVSTARATKVAPHAVVLHAAAAPHAAPLFALTHGQDLGILALMLLALPVSFLIARSAIRRHFPKLAGAAHWVAVAFGTLVLWVALYEVGGLALGPLVAVFGGTAVAMALLGWLVAGLGVYLAEVYFIKAGWTRMSARNLGGASNWLVALVSRGGVRYVLTLFAGMLPSMALFEIAAGLHTSAEHAVPLLIGCGIASLFHPPSFFFYRSIAPLVSGAWLRRRPRGDGAPPLEPPAPKRGTWLVSADSAARYLAWVKSNPTWPADPIPFGTQVIHASDEVLHSKIMGATGAGKSTAIRAMLRKVAKRPQQRAIIADPDGGYAARFFRADRGDVILNPFDARATGWDLFADIKQEYDADNLAASLIADKAGEQGEWAKYAQQLTAACIRALRTKGAKEQPTSADLWRLIATTPPAVLSGLLADTEAAPFLARGNEKMFGGIRATAVSSVKGLSFLRPGERMLSLSQYAQGDSRGWIFLTYTSEQIAAVRSLYATMLRVLIFSTMSRPEGDAGTWFVIDELDALGKIDGLTDALARLRKFGGRCVLGFQSIGQLVELYGHEMASALTENCANTMILRSGGRGSEGTSNYAAGLLGKREVLKTQEQEASSGGTQGDGSQHAGWSKSTSTSLQVEDVMLASEIEQLPNLSGVCHAHDFTFWAHFTLAPDSMPAIAPAFLPRPPATPDPGTVPPAGPPNTPALAEVIPLVSLAD
jgi:hypothetical protein